RVVSEEVARHVLAVMATCGMYDAAGDWMSTVGIPAKSGVSGGILGSLPAQVGLGMFSPRLDAHGHSVEGVRAFEQTSRDLDLHRMNSAVLDVEAVRAVLYDEANDRRVFRLQGSMTFASAALVLRRVAEIRPGDGEVTLDLSRVSSVNTSARRMLLDG